nr:SGNH hydrolase domain-containing protein [Microbacterium endophyticum]
MDSAITAGSQTNPARTCFEPATTPDVNACTWGNANAPRHMYLVGDSTAMAYAPAFKKIAENSGGNWRITTIGLYGCRFTDVLVQNSGAGVMDACTQRKADIAAIVAADSPDLVVVSNAYTLGNTVAGQPLSVTDLVSGTQNEMAQFDAAGRILYLAPPPMGASLGSCYSPLTSPLNCLAGVDPTWTEYEMAMEVAATVSGDHAMSSLSFSCWEGSCPAFAGGIPTKYDQTHMTAAYAEHIAPVIQWNLTQLGLM